jgi:hypothetical protein
MSTRTRIAVENADGSFTSIYTHWDGADHGPILLANYHAPSQVAALMALGDLSSLGNYLVPPDGAPHSYSHPARDVCVAYGRDRGETEVGSAHSSNLKALVSLARDCDAEYLYIFRGDRWLVAAPVDGGMRELTA